MTQRNEEPCLTVEDRETSESGTGFDSRRLQQNPRREIVEPGLTGPESCPKPARLCRCGAATKHGRRYCSGACLWRYRNEDRHPREPALCAQCGVAFDALVATIKAGRPVFCTVQCSGAHARATGRFRGANNPRWLGGVSTDNMRYRRRQIERWPHKDAARRAVRNAVRSRRLTRLPCERCGDPKSEGHHDDYSKQLEVRWLCKRHHTDVHNELRALGRDPDAPTPTAKGTP